MEPWLIVIALGALSLLIALLLPNCRTSPKHQLPTDGFHQADSPDSISVSVSLSGLAVTPPSRSEPDMFDESRMHQDLESLVSRQGFLSQQLALHSKRRQREKEIALINQWTGFYGAGTELIKSKTELLRARNEHYGLQRENEEKNAQKEANIAKFQADAEEHRQRAKKASGEHSEADEPIVVTQYKQELMADAQKQIFDKFGLPTFTQIQAAKLRDDLRSKIDRDRTLSDKDKDAIKTWLDDLYEQQAKHKKFSIFED